jgi:hypothetical protein
MIDHVKSKWQWRPRASLANRQSRLVPVHSRNCSKQIVLHCLFCHLQELDRGNICESNLVE